MRRKRNPLLIRVNPQSEAAITGRGDQEVIWQEAKRKMPSITRKEFDAALQQFVRQHGTMPQRLTVEDVPGISGDVKILIKVGNVAEIRYEPDDHSRKAPYAYYHKTKAESLLTDASGEVLVLHGKTRVCNGPKRGWLIN